MQTINFRDPSHYDTIFDAGPIRNSTLFGWKDLYLERREDALFEAPEHRVDGHYLMVKLNPWSVAERRIDGRWRSEVQRRGAVAYVPDGCSHSVRYLRPLGALCFITLSNALVSSVSDELNQPRFRGEPRYAKETDATLLNALECMDLEIRDGNPNGPLFAQSYGNLIAAHLVMGYGNADRAQRSPRDLPHKKMKWLDEYIDANLAEAITLDELARQVNLSPYYFTRLFKATSGMAPYQYVLHKRIEFARECLRRDQHSIEDIALACGFNDPSRFAKQFKKICAQTPSAYRRQCHADGSAGRSPG